MSLAKNQLTPIQEESLRASSHTTDAIEYNNFEERLGEESKRRTGITGRMEQKPRNPLRTLCRRS
jgi:hypothetical protein